VKFLQPKVLNIGVKIGINNRVFQVYHKNRAQEIIFHFLLNFSELNSPTFKKIDKTFKWVLIGR